MKHSTHLSKNGPKDSFKGIVLRTLGLSTLAIATSLLPALPGQALEFPQTGDRGAPERTSGGGTRGDRCAADIDTPIQAIVPKNNVSTFAEPQAKLWIHLPEGLAIHTAEVFVKHAETHEIVYEHQTNLPKIEHKSLIELTLPASHADGSPLLKDNQDYLWEFAIICDNNDRTRDRYTQGFLHKVTNDEALRNRMSVAANQEAIATARSVRPEDVIIEMYAGAELWQETLSLAIDENSYRTYYWKELLSSVGLEEIDNSYSYPVKRFVQQLSLPQAEQ